MKLMLSEDEVLEAVRDYVARQAGYTAEEVVLDGMYGSDVAAEVQVTFATAPAAPKRKPPAKGAKCPQCGKGPFTRLQSHVNKMHPSTDQEPVSADATVVNPWDVAPAGDEAE